VVFSERSGQSLTFALYQDVLPSRYDRVVATARNASEEPHGEGLGVLETPSSDAAEVISASQQPVVLTSSFRSNSSHMT
jgi:hypothetical protein